MDNPENKSLSLLSFCTGYGGIELGLELAGLRIGRCVYVERECYAAAVVVKAIEAGALAPGIVHTDLTTFPAEIFRGCFAGLVGGYPCQPFSTAGNREGANDSKGRHLWPYFKRTIELVRPGFCFFENVEGHITLGLKDVCHDLGELGYEYTCGIFSAEECGAPHQRRRIFILARQSTDSPCSFQEGTASELADSNPEGLERGIFRGEPSEQIEAPSARCSSEKLANPNSLRGDQDRITTQLRAARPRKSSSYCWPSAPGENQQEWEVPRLVADPYSINGGARGESRESPGKSSGKPIGNDCELVDPSNSGLPLRPPEPQGRSTKEQEPQRSNGKGECETFSGLGGSIDGPDDFSYPAASYMGPAQNRIDRLRMLGNGVIAQTAAKAFVELWNELDTPPGG